jgi:hypothetical protein
MQARELGDLVPESTLLARLTEAVTAALAADRASLEYAPERLRSVTVELQLANGGTVISEARCRIERVAASLRGE